MGEQQEILRFWFGEIGADGRVADEVSKRWWKKDPELDAEIGRRFGPAMDRAARGELREWEASAHGRLALIVLLDQWSRNVFRDTPRAFAQDAEARRICLEGIDTGADRELLPIERSMFYMPLMHAEDRALQRRAVELFEALAREGGPDSVSFAVRHREIVERFGRFPHRNRILGRESTDEELEFLTQPGSSF